MRSFDRAMPEELNRVLTDHLSDLLLCPSPTAVANLERERVAGRVELVGDVMVDVALLFQPRARADDAPLRAAGVSAGRVRAGDRAPRGQRRRPARACARSSTCCSRCRCRSSCRCTRAPARGSRRPGWLGELEAAAHVRLLPPLGYLAFTALLVARPRRAHRLGRRAEGGLPGRRAVRDDARHDRVGRDRRGGLERARRPRRRRGAGRARAHAARPSAPSSTATGAPASASSPRSPRADGLSRRRCAAAPRRRRRSARRSSTPRPSTIARTPGRSSGPSAR